MYNKTLIAFIFAQVLICLYGEVTRVFRGVYGLDYTHCGELDICFQHELISAKVPHTRDNALVSLKIGKLSLPIPRQG